MHSNYKILHLSEKELLENLRNKQEDAFRELVNLFQDKVFNTALNFLQDPHDAEDTAQEVFIQVYQSIGQFRGNSTLSTWIYRITLNKCRDHYRKKNRKKRLALIRNLFSDSNQPLYEKSELNHPGVQLDRKEDAAMLFNLMKTLPEKQRTAFLLNKIDGLSYLEIAEIMQMSESAIDSLLQRAKQNLRKKIVNNQE